MTMRSFSSKMTITMAAIILQGCSNSSLLDLMQSASAAPATTTSAPCNSVCRKTERTLRLHRLRFDAYAHGILQRESLLGHDSKHARTSTCSSGTRRGRTR